MISIKVKRKGSLDIIAANLAAAASKGIDNAVENTQKEAISLKHRMTNGDGTLDKNIITGKIGELEGRVYTNHQALIFVEYGTGIKKDPDFPHIGTTKTFKESGYKFWFVPVDKVDKPIGPLVRIGDSEYYMAFSQAAKPFMRTAAFNRRYNNIDDVKKAMDELIRSNAL